MKPITFSVFLTVAALLIGCGGGEKKAASDTPPSDTPPGVKVVHLTGDDTMHYNVTEITAAPGEALRVELKNIGRMPKQTMAHNWVLLKPMSEVEVGKLAMNGSMKPPTYMPADQSAIIVHIKLLGPGETGAVDFKAPTTPGEYPYFCSFPGHFALMRGKLIVK